MPNIPEHTEFIDLKLCDNDSQVKNNSNYNICRDIREIELGRLKVSLIERREIYEKISVNTLRLSNLFVILY